MQVAVSTLLPRTKLVTPSTHPGVTGGLERVCVPRTPAGENTFCDSWSTRGWQSNGVHRRGGGGGGLAWSRLGNRQKHQQQRGLAAC